MNRDIGIITSTQSFGNNYGAILQAYALSTILKESGYHPYIIKYKREEEFLQGTAPVLERLKATLLNPNTSIRSKRVLLYNYITKRSPRKQFLEFEKKYLSFFKDEYVEFETLKKNPPPYDTFIVGSDQVWNPVIHGNRNDPGYFLDFVPDGQKRIAYAPSIGVDAIPDSCKDTLGPFLVKFDALSVRERTGQKIIKDACGIDVRVTLDPTLLLKADEWEKVSEACNSLPERYILCYKFGNSKQMDYAIRKLSKMYRMPVVAVPASTETKFHINYGIGPGEFLAAVRNAAIVFSDSFHATVFSIIFKRPFYTFPREGMETTSKMNGRMQDLLQMVCLEDRYITSAQEVDEKDPFAISFQNSEDMLQRKRTEDLSFLLNAIKEIHI